MTERGTTKQSQNKARGQIEGTHRKTGGGGARHTQRSNVDDDGVIEFEQGGGGEGLRKGLGNNTPKFHTPLG